MNWTKDCSVSKKKSKLSPAQQNVVRVSQPRPRVKTENSPPRSLSKQQIKNTIKKIVYNHTNSGSMGRPSRSHLQPRQQSKRSRKIRSGMEIQIPNIETSLTPKGFNNTNKYGDRQVQSTKAADSKMFSSSGRYDLKKLFEPKKHNQPHLRDPRHSENRTHSYGKDSFKMKPFSPANRNKKDITKFQHREEQPKISREQEFDPRTCLTSDEYEKFGDRFPDRFKRIALLGRGGFSVVWLGVHRSTKRKFAIKQILTKNPHETHLKEIWFGSYFFDKGGEAREQFEDHIGINNICRLCSFEIKSVDSWLYYQVCQESLGSCLFELKGESLNNERVYKIQYKELVYRMRSDVNELKYLIIQIAKALHLINSHNIVHSDLKTENILLRTRKDVTSHEPFIKELKLIDFGSSFLFTNLKQFSMATPEYMPPQILNYILYQNKLEYDVLMLNKMEKYKNPWVVDVWSLGCIVLEIVTGLPLWMSLPTRIEGSNHRATGLFAVKGRLFNKIIEKQISVVENLHYHLTNDNHSGIKIDQEISSALTKMLSLNPDQRISPVQILNEFGIPCRPEKIPSY